MGMMRDYVRLVRRHSGGVPVSVDSSSPQVLRAGLEAWYQGAEGLPAVPLLNSVKTYTLDELLPLRGRFPFKFIGLLVDIKSTGSEGSYYSVEELLALARTIFRGAVGRYGFKPGMFPEAERVSDQVMSLPLGGGTTDDEAWTVVAALRRAILGRTR